MKTLSELFLAHLKKIWLSRVRFSTLNPRGCSFRIYKHACFDVLKKSLTSTNSLSVNKLFSWCIILRSALSFGNHTNMVLAYLLNFLLNVVKMFVIFFQSSLKQGEFFHNPLDWWIWLCFLYTLSFFYLMLVLFMNWYRMKSGV